jgi:hypothetical protein
VRPKLDDYKSIAMMRRETPMPPNEPASFTDEDRARVEEAIERLAVAGHCSQCGMRINPRNEDMYHFVAHPKAHLVVERYDPPERADALTRALAYITYLEGALEAADELAGCADRDYDREDYWTRLDEAVLAYRSTRAALPTSKEGAG